MTANVFGRWTCALLVALLCSIVQPMSISAQESEDSWNGMKFDIFGDRPIADAGSLLEMDAPGAVQELFDAYPDDASAVWMYGRALHEFRSYGDTPETRRLLGEARDWNPHVPAYLTGRKRLPRRLPALIGMGDESEAIAYAAEQMAVWRATPGAIAWLGSASR